MAGGGSSSSQPVNMTPQAFQALQGPYASVIGQLLGFAPTSTAAPVSSSSGTRTSTGGGGNGNGASNYTPFPTSTTRVSAGQKASASSYAPVGNVNDVLRGIPTYQGDLVAPMTANEGTLLDQLMKATGAGGTDASVSSYLKNILAGGGMPNAQPTLASFNQRIDAAHATPDYDPNQENPFLAAAITAAQRPTLQGLTETLTRDLPGRFTQSGQMVQPQGSSAFDRAAAIASRGASDTMGDIATNLSYQTTSDQLSRIFQANQSARGAEDTSMQAELARRNANTESAKDRQLQAAGTAVTASQAQVSNMVQNLQAQALPRLIQEYGIERGMDMFNNQVNGLLSVLGIAGGVTQPTTATSSQSKTKPNLLPMLPH